MVGSFGTGLAKSMRLGRALVVFASWVKEPFAEVASRARIGEVARTVAVGRIVAWLVGIGVLVAAEPFAAG